MMRKPYFAFTVIFFSLSWVILYFSPASKDILQGMLNNSDLLFPFSLYNGIVNPSIRPVWVFGGYTPFLELVLGFLIWLPFKNIPLTFMGYAVFQSGLIYFSLSYFVGCLVGKNRKINVLILLMMALTNLAAASGWFLSLNFQYFWYLHITTSAMAMIALGLLIKFVTADPSQSHTCRITLLKLSAVCVLGVLSDALFISQLVVPALVLLVGMCIFSFISIRWAGLAMLSLLGSTVIGWALFRIPVLWGSRRIELDNFYVNTDIHWVLNNITSVFKVVSSAWENHLAVALLWILFYLVCTILGLLSARHWLLKRQGVIRKRWIMSLFFFPLQLLTSLSAGLLTVEPNLRYFIPLIFFPLAWGWPILAIQSPFWMKFMQSRRILIAISVSSGIAAILLMTNFPASSGPAKFMDYYPQDIQCLDQNAVRLNLRAGIAQYWLARRFTLYSQAGVQVVQATPDLSPYPILADIQSYDRKFEFVVVENGAQYYTAIDRNRVIQRFGEPAATFTCANLEIWVYNRAGDAGFAHQFDEFIKLWN